MEGYVKGLKGKMCIVVVMAATIILWVMRTPLGTPVEPDVYLFTIF